MSDKGIRDTDKLMAALGRRLNKVYGEAYQTAIANNKKALEKYAALTDEALKDLTPDERKLKREAFAGEIKRTDAVIKNIAAEIAGAGSTAANMIQGDTVSAYGINRKFMAGDITQQAGFDISWAMYDRNQLVVLVQEGQSPFTKIAYNNLGKDKKVVKRLQNQFIQGVLSGESQQKLARRIKIVTGQSSRQAKRVAQTERTRVQSQARAYTIHEANDIGVITDKEWRTRMIRSRDSHIYVNGEVVEDGELFSNGLEFPGDPNGPPEEVINCHCYLRSKVRRKAGKTLQDIARSDIIKLPDTHIGRSVGAKAKNYDILTPDGGIARFIEGTKIQNSQAFAGYGTRTSLHEGVAEGLLEELGGDAKYWIHAKGEASLEYEGESRKAEVHWFQNKDVGKHKFKVKEWLD